MYAQKKIYFNLRPAVIVTAGLIFGILSGYLFLFESKYFSMLLLFSALFIGVILTCYYFIVKQKLNAFTFLFFILSLLLGVALFLAYVYSNYTFNGSSSFNGVVVEIFSENFDGSAYTYSLIVKGDFLDNEGVKAYADVVSKSRIFQGSEISFRGYFDILKLDDFSLSTGCYYTINVDAESVKVGEISSLLLKLKQRILLALENSASNTYGFNYALVTGETCYADKSVLSKYQDLGIAHVFAVSGLHVGLTYFALKKVTSLFTNKPIISFSVITLILFLYVWFCGFTPSSLRAFIIITVRNFAKMIGSKSDDTSNVAVSAFIVLIVNPTDLLSAGFMLSYTVYLGLILLTKPLSNLLNKFLPKRISKVVAPCLVAQTVAFPLLIEFFGYASPFSFIFNLFIIPFIALAFPYLIFFYVLLAIFPNGAVFGVIPNLVFTVIEFVLSFINTKAFMIENISFSFSIVFYYAFLYLFAEKFNFSKKTVKLLRIITLIAFLLLIIIINI